MAKYIIRLDDACEKMNINNWKSVESIFCNFSIRPLVGIIPHCEDKSFDIYEYNHNFWDLVQKWINNGWIIAMHGYNHVYISNNGGINPVNKKSEFAGVSYEIQKEKIVNANKILISHNIHTQVFFAPSHTFDYNTILALKNNTEIRFISDTIANDIYSRFGFTFVPQQSGKPRKLPFKVSTICLHPNNMCSREIKELELFVKNNKNEIVDFPLVKSNKKYDLLDSFLSNIYFQYRKIRKIYFYENKN